jgi:hypothetical protein
MAEVVQHLDSPCLAPPSPARSPAYSTVVTLEAELVPEPPLMIVGDPRCHR